MFFDLLQKNGCREIVSNSQKLTPIKKFAAVSKFFSNDFEQI